METGGSRERRGGGTGWRREEAGREGGEAGWRWEEAGRGRKKGQMGAGKRRDGRKREKRKGREKDW